jgi:two-component system response regulator FixJ
MVVAGGYIMRLALEAAALPAASDARPAIRRDSVARPGTGDAHHRPRTPGRPPAILPRTDGEVSKVVTIVEDDDAVGAFTAALLERAGYRVEIFGSGDAFLAAEHPGDSGCVLLDIRMPGANGLDVLRSLRSRDSMPPVVMLSAGSNVHEAVAAMKLGAVDVLPTPCPPGSLLQAIGQAVDGGAARKAGAIDPDAAAKIATLPRRQRQVLQGVVRGKPNKIIAYDLGLSVRTVETYRAQFLRKLEVRGTAEAVRLALAAGLL